MYKKWTRDTLSFLNHAHKYWLLFFPVLAANSLIYCPLLSNLKTAWFGKQTHSLPTDSTCAMALTSFVLIVWNWLRTLSCNITWINLKTFQFDFEMKSIISIQSFSQMMSWKQPSNYFQSSECFIYVKIWFFCLICKVDFCFTNVRLLKWFPTYPLNFVSRNKYTLALYETMLKWLQSSFGWKKC